MEQCKAVDPHQSWLALNSTATDWTRGLPLYVLAPASGKTPLQTFGIEWSSEIVAPSSSTSRPSLRSLGVMGPLERANSRTIMQQRID
jgi:hypothetical protein